MPVLLKEKVGTGVTVTHRWSLSRLHGEHVG